MNPMIAAYTTEQQQQQRNNRTYASAIIKTEEMIHAATVAPMR
jgi:hypothetical protein